MASTIETTRAFFAHRREQERLVARLLSDTRPSLPAAVITRVVEPKLAEVRRVAEQEGVDHDSGTWDGLFGPQDVGIAEPDADDSEETSE